MKNTVALLLAMLASTTFAADPRVAFEFKDGVSPVIEQKLFRLKHGDTYLLSVSGLNLMKYAYKFNFAERLLFSFEAQDRLKELVTTFTAPVVNIPQNPNSYDSTKRDLASRLKTLEEKLTSYRTGLANPNAVMDAVFEDSGSIENGLAVLKTQESVDAAWRQQKNGDYSAKATELLGLKLGLAEAKADLEKLYKDLPPATKDAARTEHAKLIVATDEGMTACDNLVTQLRAIAPALKKLRSTLEAAMREANKELLFTTSKDTVEVKVEYTYTAQYLEWYKAKYPGLPEPIARKATISKRSQIVGRQAIDTSAGFLASDLKIQNYYAATGNVIAKDVSDDSDLSPMLYVHYIPGTYNLFGGNATGSLTLGIGPSKEKPVYFAGLGLHIGSENRVTITFGLAYKQTKRLGGGQVVGGQAGANGAISLKDVLRSGRAIGISFKFSL